MSGKPDHALKEILLPALQPCEHFKGACSGFCVWDPSIGQIPRAFGGGHSDPSKIRLVIVTAEPGRPTDGESYSGSPGEMFDQHVRLLEQIFRDDSRRLNGKPAPFHKNLKFLLELCWGPVSWEEIFKRTWFTNSVICSLPQGKREFPIRIRDRCGETFLRPQIDLCKNAFVLALGRPARERMARLNIRMDATAQHPSARPNTKPKESWKGAAEIFRSWLKKNHSS